MDMDDDDEITIKEEPIFTCEDVKEEQTLDDLSDVEMDSIQEVESESVTLPTKSKERYNQAFENFMKWCGTKDVVEITEDVLLAYFLEKSNILKSPASLWSEYSMLKSTIYLNKNIDISEFERLKAFLKRENDGYQPRKSQVFTRDNITKFLLEAPDEIYLMKKVVAIFGVGGACRSDELYNIKVQDVKRKNDIIMVQILSTKNNVPRKFVITNGEDQNHWMTLVQSYMELRPKNAQDRRFFYRYERGKCVNQVVGRHTISKIPFEIAKFLKLPNAIEYTGHSFRRTSSALQGNAPGIDILDLRRRVRKPCIVFAGDRADSPSDNIETANTRESSIDVQKKSDKIKRIETECISVVETIAKEHFPLDLSGTYTNCQFTFNINTN